LIDELGIEQGHLDAKKQQTDYKIKYVVEYVERWLLVSVNRPEVTNINFVDCMSNAGIYQDGDLGTSMEVLLLFVKSAAQHPNKVFNLFVNDYDGARTNICSKIAERLMQGQPPANIKVHISTLDVNEYLCNYKIFDRYFGYGSSTIAFVDPYDFGTVKIEQLANFISHYYCEVIFNFFTSDYVRNGIDKRIRACIGNVNIHNKDDLIQYIVNQMKVGKIKYVFSYQFRTLTNTELYQIIYATPHIKGLEVLKEALWKTFNGKFYHRNFNEQPAQLSLFTEDDNRQSLLQIHASSAKHLLTQNFSGQVVHYKRLEQFLTENTMMQTTDFLGSVLKPLISEGKVIKKCKTINKANYKNDEYYFEEVQPCKL
jgi:three-Cys-motif partner protein